MLDRVEIKQQYDKDGEIVEVKVNGQEIKRVRSIRYEYDVDGLPLVTLELYGEIDLDCMGEVLAFK